MRRLSLFWPNTIHLSKLQSLEQLDGKTCPASVLRDDLNILSRFMQSAKARSSQPLVYEEYEIWQG